MYVNPEFPCAAISSIPPYVWLESVDPSFEGRPCAYYGSISIPLDGGGFCVGSTFTIWRPVSLPFTASGFRISCPDDFGTDTSITFS